MQLEYKTANTVCFELTFFKYITVAQIKDWFATYGIKAVLKEPLQFFLDQIVIFKHRQSDAKIFHLNSGWLSYYSQ